MRRPCRRASVCTSSGGVCLRSRSVIVQWTSLSIRRPARIRLFGLRAARSPSPRRSGAASELRVTATWIDDGSLRSIVEKLEQLPVGADLSTVFRPPEPIAAPQEALRHSPPQVGLLDEVTRLIADRLYMSADEVEVTITVRKPMLPPAEAG